MSQLVTGDAVVLDLRTAGVPSRLLAALLDLLLEWSVTFVLFIVLGIVGRGTSGAAQAALVLVFTLLPFLVYPVAMETLLSGRTLGKMALGLRVVRDDGGPITFRHAITRGLIGLFVEKPGLTFGSAAVISALVSERGKRLGDLAAGTVVIQERVAGRSTPAVQMPPGLAPWAQSLDLSALSDDLAASAHAYLGRYASLTEAARASLGNQLAGAVAGAITPPPPSGVPAWAYLSAVLAERRRRAQAPPAPPRYGEPTAPAPAPPVEEPSASPFAPPS